MAEVDTYLQSMIIVVLLHHVPSLMETRIVMMNSLLVEEG